jgi:membrane fusion protein, multidrug efflux system
LIKRLLLIVIVIAGVGGATYALKMRKMDQMAAMGSASFPPAAVTVAAVQPESWRQTLFAVGSVVAEQGIDVTVPLPGTVTEIKFESGQDVKRGEILVQMDIGVDMAELEGLVASRELRELQFERAKKLLADHQISQSDYDAARAARDEAEAVMQTKKAYIARKRVYAPFDGTLGIRMIDLGEHLEPGDPVVPLQMLDPVHVDYAMPEQFLSRLALGQAVEIEVPAYPGEKFHGGITAIEPGIDPNTRNVRIRATIANAGRRLRPGMFAEVWTIEPVRKEVMSLPETAVTYSPFGDTVFVVVEQDGGTVVDRLQVQTGEVRDGRVEIVSGIGLGDRVVAVGQNKLRNGMPVDIVEHLSATLASETQ